tara:strand:+ start:612 stop:884 length:273 start_codon:yes stop_codon:yes gene_type:complete
MKKIKENEILGYTLQLLDCMPASMYFDFDEVFNRVKFFWKDYKKIEPQNMAMILKDQNLTDTLLVQHNIAINLAEQRKEKAKRKKKACKD